MKLEAVISKAVYEWWAFDNDVRIVIHADNKEEALDKFSKLILDIKKEKVEFNKHE